MKKKYIAHQPKDHPLLKEARKLLNSNDIEKIKSMDRKLRCLLSDIDRFWVRWSYKLEQMNIEPQIEWDSKKKRYVLKYE